MRSRGRGTGGRSARPRQPREGARLQLPDAEVSESPGPLRMACPARRLTRGVARERIEEFAPTPRREPTKRQGRTVPEDSPLDDVRRHDEAGAEEVACRGRRTSGERLRKLRPGRSRQQLVPTDPCQERAAGHGPEQRDVEVRVERPEKPVAGECLLRDRPDTVELVVVLETHPLLESEVRDHALLPLRLVRGLDRREAVRRGDRQRKPFATREVRGERENGGRVASAGEADCAGWPLQQAQNGALERQARRLRGVVSDREVGSRAEDEARRELEGRQVRPSPASARRQSHQLGERRRVAVRLAVEPRVCGEVDRRPTHRDDHVARRPVRLVPALEHERAL